MALLISIILIQSTPENGRKKERKKKNRKKKTEIATHRPTERIPTIRRYRKHVGKAAPILILYGNFP